MDITKLQSLLKITENDDSLVVIRLGWHIIARIEEEDGGWHPSVLTQSGVWVYIGNPMSDDLTKEQAFNVLVQHFIDD